MPPEDSPNDLPKQRVTLKHIAKALGVSHATVSLALRNHPRISEKTKAKIRRKAEKMGYQPDPMLASLSKYRSAGAGNSAPATLAWINPLLKNPEKLCEYEEFRLYRQGAHAAAKESGYKLEEFECYQIQMKRLDVILKTRNIRGIVIAPLISTERPDDWEHFPWNDYATVAFGQRIQFPKVHFVSSDHVSNTILAFERALEKGYQRIGFVGGYRRRRMFGAGYLWAQQALPEPQRLPPFYHRDEPYAQQLEMLQAWLAENKPDAIIIDSDLYVMFKELGVAVPDDVGLATVSFDGALDVAIKNKINAGVYQNPVEIGRSAIRILLSLLHDNKYGIPEVNHGTFVEGHWVDGSMLPDRESHRE